MIIMYSQEVKWLLEEKYCGEKTSNFFSDVDRLVAGEPLAYLIGHIPFLNTNIYLDSLPLIPRPETEHWVAEVISEIKKRNIVAKPPLHVLDLCAGSGCVGVAVSKALPDVKVDFIELEKKHLTTIEKNCLKNNLQDDVIRVIQGDLFNVGKTELFQYDFILTNPPYIDPVLNRTEKNVRDFEPKIALYGGLAGMEIINRIINEAPNHLKAGGQLWIEHEPEQVEAILQIASSRFRVLSLTDQYKLARYSKLVLQ
jgi:release factor glutamine methyltransferase